MTRGRRLAVASVLALAVAALTLVLAPAAVPEEVLGPISRVSPGWVLRAIGIVLLVLAGGRFLFGVVAGTDSSNQGSEPAATGWKSDRPTGNTHEVVGERLDTQLDAIEGHRDTVRADVLRDELRPLAVELLRRVEDIDREAARTRVARGEWTDDPRASAFFATEPVAIPLRIRIVDRLADEPRRYRQAVHAIEAMAAYRSRLGVAAGWSDSGDSGRQVPNSREERSTSDTAPVDSAETPDGSSPSSASSEGTVVDADESPIDPEGDRA